MLDDQLSYPIYKVSCPTISLDGSEASISEKTYLIGRYAFGHYAPVGRCTKGYPALDMQTKRLVWFKDQWRCAARPHTELDAYMRLHKHHVTYIATPVAGGDVMEHRTVTQDYLAHLADSWRPSERVHTRLVTKEVGRLLETYKDSWELLRVCTEAFFAHQEAWEEARILHRDISIGNIMIDTQTGKGFLNDWDLCKYREDMETKRPASEPSGISGTWAFKSALALRYPRKPPELADDLESFIHVITFLAYRFHDHELSSEPLEDTEDAQITANANNPELMGLVSVFFYAQKRVGNGFYKGGGLKYHMILSGLPPVPFKPLKNGKRSLVETFLLKAYQLLQEHYWSLDESEFAEYAAHEGDCAAPDEVDYVATSGPPLPLVEAPAEYLGQDPIYASMWARNARRTVKSSKGKEVFWKTVVRKKPSCPFDDPQPVLESHTDLAFLFLSIARDEHGNDLDLQAYRDDKRFDQFLNWRMVCYLDRKGKTGQWKTPSPSGESGAKRKREEEDTGEAPKAPKRPTVPRTGGPRTRALVKAEEQAVAPQEAAVKKAATGKRKSAAATAVGRSMITVAKAAPPQKATGPQSKKKAPTSRAASKKGNKPQPTKTATKASASRKAQASRKSPSPRRPAAVKAEVTGRRSKTAKAKAAAPPAPTRRSERLAKKS
ncbi:uncharacterized protein PHACADRAFT_207804 [Phanerochaete carnosa HHB-10118-sp]|uniref:Fungal-type protein kinase domain-containing protein n=1 Tax=Phanerochaete carnosa (strain HHB-10118-sp) TaxID=650164 RepID=K5WBK2_PHACS|nr:uncharacterized protein PHACADRAFT_207804 [Phanerochaete carnosa HHB-10118-sp]EKM56600.1 hypothetical protein PHACADRAFT_207804 [Phanerochaete carnosa HHB-10118-sp]